MLIEHEKFSISVHVACFLFKPRVSADGHSFTHYQLKCLRACTTDVHQTARTGSPGYRKCCLKRSSSISIQVAYIFTDETSHLIVLIRPFKSGIAVRFSSCFQI